MIPRRWTLFLPFLTALAGCADPESAMTLTTASGAQAPVTFALVDYTPEFSRALAAQMRAAPKETGIALTDYLKLRCQIQPERPVCAVLRK